MPTFTFAQVGCVSCCLRLQVTTTLLYYTILYHTIPYYTILYHTVPYYTILYHTIPYYAILHHATYYILKRVCVVEPSHAQSRSGSARRQPSLRVLPVLPSGSMYPIFEVLGSKSHTLNGFGDQKPLILGTWTLWVKHSGYVAKPLSNRPAKCEDVQDSGTCPLLR